MEARIIELERALNNRDAIIRESITTAVEAALQARAAAAPQSAEGNQNGREERRYDIACKALGSAPKYHGTTSWRTFECCYEVWYRVNRIHLQTDEFQKRSLIACMRGRAVEITRPYGENSPTWTASADLTVYLNAFRRVFLPPEESELARSEFKGRKQGRKEDISSYLSSKISLWQTAYPEAERSLAGLVDEVIGGVSNRVVKCRLRYAEITDIVTLRRAAVKIVAAERQCYREGTSESTNMDGLAATTHIAREYGEEDEEGMDIDDDGVNELHEFRGKCRKCNIYGHKASQCKKKAGSPGNKERKCFRCDRAGHMIKDCRAKTKADGGKIEDKKVGDRQKDRRRTRGGKASVRTQGEETDTEGESDSGSDFLDVEGESEEKS